MVRVSVGVLTALMIGPPAVLTSWYSRRLKEVKEARESDDRSPESTIYRTQLEARVTREGWLVLVAVGVYWGILSLIF